MRAFCRSTVERMPICSPVSVGFGRRRWWRRGLVHVDDLICELTRDYLRRQFGRDWLRRLAPASIEDAERRHEPVTIARRTRVHDTDDYVERLLGLLARKTAQPSGHCHRGSVSS